jgi:uncharacterized protein involved in copper resistance
MTLDRAARVPYATRLAKMMPDWDLLFTQRLILQPQIEMNLQPRRRINQCAIAAGRRFRSASRRTQPVLAGRRNESAPGADAIGARSA